MPLDNSAAVATFQDGPTSPAGYIMDGDEYVAVALPRPWPRDLDPPGDTCIGTSPCERDENGADIVPVPGPPTQADIEWWQAFSKAMGYGQNVHPPFPTFAEAKEWRKIAADETNSDDVRRHAAARADMLEGLFIVHLHPGTMETTVDEVERVLLAAGRGLYQRHNEIVTAEQAKIEVRNGKNVDSMIIVPRGARALIEDLSACAIIQKWDKREKKYVVCDAPMSVVQTLQQRIGRLNFPVLTGLVFAPTMRPDGSVIDMPGYDSDTGLLFNPMGIVFPPVPHSPSMSEARNALGVLCELISDFPFVDSEGTEGASKSVALSAILTACVRPAFPHAPLHAFTAPTAGTGKSKLVDIASVLAKGHECRVTAMSRTGEELEKRLGALMIEGDNFITIDNCEWPLGNDFLCQMLTQPVVKPRILGKSESPECSATKVFAGATGNNLQIKGDLTRRAVLCSLDARVERPELREFDVEPVAEAKRKRPQLVAAALTILRGYIAAGCPDQNITHLGSFEEWSKLVRSALLWLCQGDPVDTMHKIRELDPEREDLQEVVMQWDAVFQNAAVTTAEAVKEANETDHTSSLKYPAFRDALLAVAGIRNGSIDNKRLGKYLAKNGDKIIGERVLRKVGKKGHVPLWRLDNA